MRRFAVVDPPLLVVPVLAPSTAVEEPVVTAAVQVSSDRAYVRAHSSPRSSVTPDRVLLSGDPRGSANARFRSPAMTVAARCKPAVPSTMVNYPAGA